MQTRDQNRINILAKIIEDQAKEIKLITMEDNMPSQFLVIYNGKMETRPTFEKANNRGIELLDSGEIIEYIIALQKSHVKKDEKAH